MDNRPEMGALGPEFIFDQMMRITIDVTPTIQSQAGLGRYAVELTQALLATCPVDEQIQVFYIDRYDRQLPSPLNILPGSKLSLAGKPWRMKVLLAYLLHRPQNGIVGQPSLFHAIDHLLPYLTGIASIFSLGDITFISHPHTHSRLNRTYLRLMIPHFL